MIEEACISIESTDSSEAAAKTNLRILRYGSAL